MAKSLLSIYWTVVQDLLLTKSFPIFVIYLCFVAVTTGRRYRKYTAKFYCDGDNRSFEKILKYVLLAYNVAISLVNVVCFLGFSHCLFFRADNIYSKEFDPVLSDVYLIYWITKVVELMDTVFMVIRGKFRQVSSLHVYHHASMLLLSELGCTKYSWPAFAMALMLNSLVHVVLYLYYGLTAIGMQPGWKQQLTQLQIVQFIIDIVYCVGGVLWHNFCYWSLAYAASMLYLFTNFYLKAYCFTVPDTTSVTGQKKQR